MGGRVFTKHHWIYACWLKLSSWFAFCRIGLLCFFKDPSQCFIFTHSRGDTLDRSVSCRMRGCWPADCWQQTRTPVSTVLVVLSTISGGPTTIHFTEDPRTSGLWRLSDDIFYKKKVFCFDADRCVHEWLWLPPTSRRVQAFLTVRNMMFLVSLDHLMVNLNTFRVQGDDAHHKDP